MFYIKHKEDDFTELLTQYEFASATPHFDNMSFGANPVVERIPVEITPHGNRSLLLEKESGSWCFLEKDELLLYQSLDVITLAEILAQHPGIDEHEIKEFIIRLYQLGLVQINKTSFFDSSAFKQGAICKPQAIFAIKLTDRCNLACSYCSANAASSRHGMDMDWASAKKALDLIIDYPSKSAFIILIGGEPLLTFSLIEKIVHYARERAEEFDKHIRFGVQTNGTLLSKSILIKLEKLGIQVGVSLDGDQLTNDQTRHFPGDIGAHRSIVRGLASAKNQTCGVICVVSKANYKRIPRVMDYFSGLGIRNVKLNPISRLGRARQSWTELALTADEFLHASSEYLDYVADGFAPILEENTRHMIHNLASKMHHSMCSRAQCGAGENFFAFTPDGRVFPCDRFREYDELSLGEVKNINHLQGVVKANPLVKALNERWPDNITHCRECSYKRFCASGCTLDSYSHFGETAASHPWCQYYKGIYGKLLRKLNEIPGLAEHLCPESVVSYNRAFFKR